MLREHRATQTPSAISRSPTETAPLLFSYTPLPSPNRTYGTSSPASPRSPPVFWPELRPKRSERIWKRWTGGAGIVADFEWPFRHTWLGRDEDDAAALLGVKDGGRKTTRRWREDLPPDALVLPLFLITFSCAMADAGTLVGYQTFATSMTGNTVLLAISTFGLSHKPPIYAAASLLTFVGAGLIFGQLGGVIGAFLPATEDLALELTKTGHRRRSWLLSSLSFQIVFLLVAAWTASPYAWKTLRPGGQSDWVYLFFIGLQGGPQVTLATNAGVRELPTAMMTTPYAAFISDPSLFSLPSSAGDISGVISRNRRFIYIVLFWAGAFAGGALLKWSSLWVLTVLVALLKIIAVGMVWASKGTISNDEDAGDESESEDEDEAVLYDEAIANIPLENSMFSIDREGFKARKRTSSVFEALSRQKPRDEQNVAM